MLLEYIWRIFPEIKCEAQKHLLEFDQLQYRQIIEATKKLRFFLKKGLTKGSSKMINFKQPLKTFLSKVFALPHLLTDVKFFQICLLPSSEINRFIESAGTFSE